MSVRSLLDRVPLVWSNVLSCSLIAGASILTNWSAGCNVNLAGGADAAAGRDVRRAGLSLILAKPSLCLDRPLSLLFLERLIALIRTGRGAGGMSSDDEIALFGFMSGRSCDRCRGSDLTSVLRSAAGGLLLGRSSNGADTTVGVCADEAD